MYQRSSIEDLSYQGPCFVMLKIAPRSVQQNSNEKMKLDLKVSFILAFPGNICVVIFNQLLNNCYLWL